MAPKRERMERIAPVSIERIAFGVRYEPQYSVMDRMGSVIDAVLRNDGTPFGPKTFPLCHHGAVEKVLMNQENNDSLRLNERDTILQMSISTRTLSRVQELAVDFENYVLQPLRSQCKLTNIVRYGALCRLSECASGLSALPTEHYLAGDFEAARSLSLRFTRRLPVMEALAKKDVGDYTNVIYTIEQDEEAHVNVTIDYQEYFQPILSSTERTKKPFPNFVDRAIDYLVGEFANWFGKLSKESEVA